MKRRVRIAQGKDSTLSISINQSTLFQDKQALKQQQWS